MRSKSAEGGTCAINGPKGEEARTGLSIVVEKTRTSDGRAAVLWWFGATSPCAAPQSATTRTVAFHMMSERLPGTPTLVAEKQGWLPRCSIEPEEPRGRPPGPKRRSSYYPAGRRADAS